MITKLTLIDTDWELLAETTKSIDKSFGNVNGEVAHVDSRDVCDRCRNTPWIDDPLDKTKKVYMSRELLSAACPMCDIFLSRNCELSDIKSSLTWDAGIQVSSIIRPRLEHATGSQIHLRRTIPLTDEYLIWSSNMGEGIANSDYQYCDPPTISFSQIREHIDVCMEHHECCSLGFHRTLEDLRVIDCEQRLLVDVPTDCRYIALSYVWGELSGSEDFVLSHSLPPTIEHSILTTLKLRYRHLWIDRYVS